MPFANRRCKGLSSPRIGACLTVSLLVLTGSVRVSWAETLYNRIELPSVWLPQSTLNVDSTANFPDSGQLFIKTATGTVVLTHTGKTATSFTHVARGDGFTLAAGDTITFQNDLRFSDILVDPNNSRVAYVTAADIGAYELFIPATGVSPTPTPTPTPAPGRAPGPLHSVFAQTALSNLNAGYSLASQNYQVLGTLDSFFAYFFAAEAQYYANLAYTNPQSSTREWYLADVCAYCSFLFSDLSYSSSQSRAAAAAGFYEFWGLVNGLFALLNP